MSIIGNNADALLRGLSDFWTRYFKDVGDLKAMYEATEVTMGQAYLNLLSDVLGAAVLEVPVFKKEYFRLITIRSDEIVDGVYTSPDVFGKVPLLQNKILSATAVLENQIDYTVDGNSILFDTALFSSGAPALTNFPYRDLGGGVWQISMWAVDAQVDQFDLYYRFGHFFADQRNSSEAYRTFIRGVMQLYLLGPAIERIESALNVVAGLPVVRNDGEVVVSTSSGADILGTDGALNDRQFTTQGAVVFDAAVVGGFITTFDTHELSNTNTYPVFGISNDGTILTLGPPLNGIGTWPGFTTESGVMWEFSKTGLQQLLTDQSTYSFPRRIPLRTDLVAGFTLSVFEPLTTAVTITDYVSDPEWWHRITIPENLWPDTALEVRQTTPKLAANTIGYSDVNGYARIGDPGFKIGPADGVHWDATLQTYVDDVLGTPATPLPRYRQRAAFIVLDRYLKAHLFGVTIDQRIEITGVLVADVLALLSEVKPTHTQMYFQTGVRMKDSVAVEELSLVTARPKLIDTISELDTRWHIGDPGIHIGDRYDFVWAGGVVAIVSVSGAMAFIIGGPNPTLASIPGTVRDDVKVISHPA